jgi:cystathionine beta-lyase
MAEICLAHDVLICSDEIHADLIYSESRHIPIASLSPEISAKTVTYLAPSKTFNIAGLSTSVFIAQDPAMREHLTRSMSMILGHPNILGLHAARAAYQHGQAWLDAALNYLEANRNYLWDTVQNQLPGVEMWRPEGTFLAWLDCRGLDLDVSPFEFFLNKAKVGLNDGQTFGASGAGFVRMNFGCPKALLEEGLERMRIALDER